MNEAIKKNAGIALFYIILFIVLIILKVYHSSQQEYDLAETAYSQNDIRGAITHYERAMLWYLPLGGYVEPATIRLWSIAEALEANDRKLALEVYRRLRSAFYATRSFYTPGQDWITRVNPKIARLMAEDTNYSEADRKKSIEQKTAEALAILEKPTKPDPFWSIILEIGFIGWVSGVLIFIWRAFRKGSTHIILNQGIIWGTVIIVFYALWIIGMAKA